MRLWAGYKIPSHELSDPKYSSIKCVWTPRPNAGSCFSLCSVHYHTHSWITGWLTAAHLRSGARLSRPGPARILPGSSSWTSHVEAGSRAGCPPELGTQTRIWHCNHPRLKNPLRKTWSRAGKGSPNWSSARQKIQRGWGMEKQHNNSKIKAQTDPYNYSVAGQSALCRRMVGALRATGSPRSITIKDWAKCGVNSIWLPRQVNNKTYHCIHGDLSAGRRKNRENNNPVLLLSSAPSHFERQYEKLPRPLKAMLRTPVPGSLMWRCWRGGDVRAPTGCGVGTEQTESAMVMVMWREDGGRTHTVRPSVTAWDPRRA